MNKKTDVIVVGGGHAGIEAALAAARLGSAVVMVTMTRDTIGLMPCNPSIGGPAKGQIAGEIDALGGEMGAAADATMIQMKVLNRSRGPAVQCLRSQNDKHEYNDHMKQVIANTPNITVIEGEVTGMIVEECLCKGIVMGDGAAIEAKSVVITTGTFLNSLMHIGLSQEEGGRVGEQSANQLSQTLYQHFRVGRLKTGTPPRLDRRTIDFDRLNVQPGDPEWLHFSFRTDYHERYVDQTPCYLSETNETGHAIIMNNLDRSPMYTDKIVGKGPRYCPSIEDKIVRFHEKPSHQIFIEPEGRNTDWIYPQGLNTSLPEDVQLQLLHSMRGLETVEVFRYGYAVEYDFVYPDQLHPTLETRPIRGLFLGGQINGTSGYEEAAAQGLVAGANAALAAQKREPMILKRESSFIGTLIDDLITKPIYEPYRMLTSRSEYRLLLRQDNVTERLSPIAHALGLLSDEQMNRIESNHIKTKQYLVEWKKTSVSQDICDRYGLKQKVKMHTLIKRPDVKVLDIFTLPGDDWQAREAIKGAEIQVKYEGYIAKQEQDIAKMQKLENQTIPHDMDYSRLKGLRKESQEKLAEQRPLTIYEAKRISGVNPADIMILIMYLERTGLKHE